MVLSLRCHAVYEEDFLNQDVSFSLYNHLIDNYAIDSAFLKMDVPGMAYVSDFCKISFTDPAHIVNERFPPTSYGQLFAWDDEMRTLKTKVEAYAGVEFGMCVCIYYPDGNTGVDFHSDLIAFGSTDLIPSISLGARRNFVLRDRQNYEEYSLMLDSGSMLLMGENCQERYEHCLPHDPSCHEGRINLTFRKVDKN